jgi:hypothetical protein
MHGRITRWVTRAEGALSEANKAVVRRLVDEVLNGGRLDVIEEQYAPELAAAATRWIAPFRASFPDVRMEIVDRIAEGDEVVGLLPTDVTDGCGGQGGDGRRP